MTVRRPVIVQLAALGWSYAIVAVFVRTFSSPTRARVESCVPPPREIIEALVGETSVNTSSKRVLMANATTRVDPKEFGWMLETPWVDSANGGVAAARSEERRVGKEGRCGGGGEHRRRKAR